MNFGSLNVSYIKKYPVGVGAVVLALVMIAAVTVRHMKFSEQQVVYDNTAAEGQKLVANIAHAGQLEEQLKALEEANKTISGRLVNPSDLAINLQYFYKLEADTGVKLLEMHPVDVKGSAKLAAKGVYTPVQYVVTLQGGYVRTLAFLRRLEHGAYFCRIISGSCSQVQSTQDKVSGEVTMSLTVELLGRS
jgi:hypothetical protein